jgi:hypothetical protein
VTAAFIGTVVAAQPTPSLEFVARGTVGALDAEHQGIEVERDKGRVDHVVASITFPPGSSTGWHTHPGVFLVTVASGRVQEIDADCDPEVFTAGESFRGGRRSSRPEPGQRGRVVYVTWVIPTWTPADALSVPADAPEGCNAR